MKYSTLLLVLFMLGFAGCSDFLEESSLDEIRPSSIDDLMQIMVGEVYPLSNTVRSFQDFLTDDVECFGAAGTGVDGIPDRKFVFSFLVG